SASRSERQPVHATLLWIDDQHLVAAMLGVERQLLPALVLGRDDLQDEGGAGHIDPVRPLAEESAIRYPVVVFFTELEDADHRDEASGSCRRPEKLAQLLRDKCVPRRGCWVQHVDTLPNLVEQILPQLSAPLEKLLELHRLGISHEDRHAVKATARCGSHLTVHLPVV